MLCCVVHRPVICELFMWYETENDGVIKIDDRRIIAIAKDATPASRRLQMNRWNAIITLSNASAAIATAIEIANVNYDPCAACTVFSPRNCIRHSTHTYTYNYGKNTFVYCDYYGLLPSVRARSTLIISNHNENMLIIFYVCVEMILRGVKAKFYEYSLKNHYFHYGNEFYVIKMCKCSAYFPCSHWSLRC